MIADEILKKYLMEPIGSIGRPFAFDFDHEIAGGRFELRLKTRWCLGGLGGVFTQQIESTCDGQSAHDER